MPLSTAAEARIRALVTSGIDFTQHVMDSDHFDEDSAYHSAANFGKGKNGLGPCSFFAWDWEDDEGPWIHRTSAAKIVQPGPFSNKDAEGYVLTGAPLKQARQRHGAAQAKFDYRTRKDALRAAVQGDLEASWDAAGAIDRHALIKGFLLQKKASLHSRDIDGRIEITGPIPYGFVGWIIPPGVRKTYEAYERTETMTVVLGAGGVNPRVVTAYPSRPR